MLISAAPKKTRTALNPTQTAIQLLLQNPSLAKLATQMPALQFTEKTAEKILLLELIERCATHSISHLGELFESIEDDVTRALFARIAALPLPIPTEGQVAEFTGALQRLHEQDQAQHLSHLIAKAKRNELNADEKQLLQLLLAKKHAATIMTNETGN